MSLLVGFHHALHIGLVELACRQFLQTLDHLLLLRIRGLWQCYTLRLCDILELKMGLAMIPDHTLCELAYGWRGAGLQGEPAQSDVGKIGERSLVQEPAIFRRHLFAARAQCRTGR